MKRHKGESNDQEGKRRGGFGREIAQHVVERERTQWHPIQSVRPRLAQHPIVKCELNEFGRAPRCNEHSASDSEEI